MTASSASQSKKGGTNLVLWVTYINIVLYALSYQLQRPVEPFLIQQLTANEDTGAEGSDVARNYGNLQSFFSFCQFFGSPIVGILIDRIGIRATSTIVFGASALSYAILSQARDLQMLFISKIPTIFQAAFLVAQATAAAATHGDSALRASSLGRMTTAYTVGATIGPALGGYLAETGDFYAGAKLAVVGSLVSVGLSTLFLPKGNEADPPSTKNNVSDQNSPTRAGSRSLKKSKSSFADDLRDSMAIAVRPEIWPLLMVKVMGGVAASMHSTAFPLVLTQSLGFEPAQLGFSMSCSMFAVAAFGAVAMGYLTTHLGSFGMMNVGLVTRSMLGIFLAAIVSVSTGSRSGTIMLQVIAVSVTYSLSQHILATGLTTQTTGIVEKDEQGALLGLEHSLFSLARIGGPAIGTFLLRTGGLWMVETVCGSLDLVLVAALAVTLPQAARRAKSS